MEHQLARTHLDPNSYTYQRLTDCSPEHLYLTSRRCFVGPIPEGWLKSHRKSWYKEQLHINYSSRAATFSARENVSHQRHVTGLEGAQTTNVRPSFPSPSDLTEEVEAEGPTHVDGQQEEDVEITSPAAAVVRHKSYKAKQSSGKEHLESLRDTTSDEAQSSSKRTLSSSSKGTPAPQERKDQNPSRSRAERPSTARRASMVQVDDKLSGKVSLDGAARQMTRISPVESQNRALSSVWSESPGANASTSSLIKQNAKFQGEERLGQSRKSSTAKVMQPLGPNSSTGDMSPTRRKSHILFDAPEDSIPANLLSMARLTQIELTRPIQKVFERRSTMDGQIIRMEKMLVRIDVTQEKKLPDDYDENSSQGVITSTLERWREFMVICRKTTKSEDVDYVLQIYKTRVIPAVDKSTSKSQAMLEIPLAKRYAHVNLFSSLDKTVVIWVPEKRGTSIVILRSRTNTSGVEWLTFLRSILGRQRSTEIQVNVPDLRVSLRIVDPFGELESSSDIEADGSAVGKSTSGKEQLVGEEIVQQCLKMLRNSPDFTEVINSWTQGKQVGLAWKRYDRLEWVHGANERKMYGTMAMIRSHELELRPKEHYPTTAQTRKGKDLIEPTPVEGFLIRLTSRKGVHQRMGKLFFKRLYFHTHDQYLFFSRPARAKPPAPSNAQARKGSKVPSAYKMAMKIPLIHAVNPYPVEDGQIAWLKDEHPGTAESRQIHDDSAAGEMQRKLQILSDADGFINLCNVIKVRNVYRGATPTDEVVNEGSDVDFDMEVPDSLEDDGQTDEFDDARTFELVLRNGLVVRLQAFDKQTKSEWKMRLRDLVRYWRNRHASDLRLLKSTRERNLHELQIDEEAEAVVGQFARKWEVTKSFASAEIYNMCGIACCRAIHISGPLYRKPRLHSLFTAFHCILIPGKLLLFSKTLRKRSGKSIPNIHQERIDAIDLRDVYLYSGLLTENELLYQNRTFDSNTPGHNALPRIWLDDRWTSRDEDVMTCFVLWKPLNKGWFRSPSVGEGGRDTAVGKKARLKRVSQLGATGRSIVFKARSRAERDHWVLALSAEMERLARVEDVRIVKDGGVVKKK